MVQHASRKKRLLSLIEKTKAEGIVFLSGDSHHGEIHLDEHEGFYQFWEFTSSGINQGLPATEDQNRVGPAIAEPNFGSVEIDWKLRQVKVSVSSGSDSSISHTLPFSQLTFADENLRTKNDLSAAVGTWETRWGPLTLTKGEENKWSAVYADSQNGSITLTEKEDTLSGTWQRNNRSGTCTFSISRCGNYLLGVSGSVNKPQLMNWNGWKK